MAGCTTTATGDDVAFQRAPDELFVLSVDGQPTWDRVTTSMDGSCSVAAEVEEWPDRFSVYGQVSDVELPIREGDRLIVDASHAPPDAVCLLEVAFDGEALDVWSFPSTT